MVFRLGQSLATAGGEHAIIDIGSNTVRLVVYGGPPRAPAVLYNEKVTARLGKGVDEDGKLSEKAMAIALAALARYETLLRLRGVRDVQTVATAAVRDATNGAEFLERVTALGLSPRLLSGEEEAVASARGVLSAFPGAYGVVGDLGGGSLELIDIAAGRCEHGTSLPLGTLRLTALRSGGGTKFARRVRKMLRGAAWSGGRGQPFYLVGGSWRALARYAMLRQGWPIDDPHGFELLPEEALTLARGLASHKPVSAKAGSAKAAAREASGKPPVTKRDGGLAQLGISTSRLASLPDAAALLGVLVREMAPSKLVFSSWGLREGLLAGRLTKAALAQDPMLAGVTAFVEAQDPSLPAHAAMVSGWTAPANPSAENGDEPLRLAATMLALASMKTEPNLRAELAADWALRKRWIGLDAEGRAMIALAVMANSGHTAIPEELLRLAPGVRLREAVAWGLATRLSRRFTGANVQALASSSLSVAAGRLVLSVRSEIAALHSEAVDKDLRALADCLGLQPRFQTVTARAQLP